VLIGVAVFPDIGDFIEYPVAAAYFMRVRYLGRTKWFSGIGARAGSASRLPYESPSLRMTGQAPKQGGVVPNLLGDLGVSKSAAKFKAEGGIIGQTQVTFESLSGKRIKADIVGWDEAGNLIAIEAKYGANPPLSPNQAIAIPEIQRTGYAIPYGMKARQMRLNVGEPVKIKFRVERWP
jgi:hypothetical protein